MALNIESSGMEVRDENSEPSKELWLRFFQFFLDHTEYDNPYTSQKNIQNNSQYKH